MLRTNHKSTFPTIALAHSTSLSISPICPKFPNAQEIFQQRLSKSATHSAKL